MLIDIIKEQISKIKFLEKATEVAEKLGYEIYIVGGFVRDILLERDRNEIDFLVVGEGPKFASEFAASLGINNVVVYKNFGTAHFDFGGLKLEFVGARKESYSRESRNPIVEDGTFDDDINRRDFTINALAVSLNRDSLYNVIDRFGGIDDLKKRIIRTPLDPMITFNDDPLRILRAFRFSAQLNFGVTENVIDAATVLAPRLAIISRERITDEFLKILNAKRPSVGLKLMYGAGVMEFAFPEICKLGGVEQINEYAHKDVFLHTCQVVDNISQVSDNLWLRFAALVHDIAKPQTKKFIEGIGWSYHGHEEFGARMMKGIFKRLKLPFHKLDYVEKLVRLHLRPIALASEEVTDSAIRRLIVQAGDNLEDLIALCRADITSANQYKVNTYLENYNRVMLRVLDVQEKDKLREFQSPVRGDEIMKICELKPGPQVGKYKTAIENAILDGRIANDYNEALEYLLTIKNTIN